RVAPPHAAGPARPRGPAARHDLLDAAHALHLGGIEALDLAAGNRAVADRRDQHARQFEVDAVDQLAVDLVGGVEPLYRFAGDLPVFRVLELDLAGRVELGGRLGHFAVGRGAPRANVGDDTVGGAACPGRDTPGRGSGADQHVARRRAALAYILV